MTKSFNKTVSKVYILLHFWVIVFRDFYVVEFPKEAKEVETVPMGIIPYTWIVINPNNSVECLCRGNSEFKKAVIGKYEIPKN